MRRPLLDVMTPSGRREQQKRTPGTDASGSVMTSTQCTHVPHSHLMRKVSMNFMVSSASGDVSTSHEHSVFCV